MNNLSHTVFILLLLSPFMLSPMNAQPEETFKPYGKPLVLIYTNINSTFNKDGNSRSVDLTRAYLGYEYFFSKSLSSRINIDVADPGAGKLQMTAFIKNAFLLYKKNNFSVRFGMIGVDQYNIQEVQWGYRYIYKSFQDAYNFGPSADLGAAAEYSPTGFISFDASILNGEGYKKLQADSVFKQTIGITVKPFKGFALRGYYDRMKNNNNQQSLALFAGYSYKAFRVGAEYNLQINNGMINLHDMSGVSFYSAVNLATKFSVFARYDYLKSILNPGDTLPWNVKKDGQLFMAGLDYSPAKGVRIAPTYSGWAPEDDTMSFTSMIALNFEIRF